MPIRVYDIAVKLGVQNKFVIERAKELGISAARVPSSSLDKITGEYLQEKVSEWLQAQKDPTPYLLQPQKAEVQQKLQPPTTPQTGAGWKPIDDIPSDWQSLVNPSIVEQVKAWSEQATQMKERESQIETRQRFSWPQTPFVRRDLPSLAE
jgi:hypothetical protein